MSTGDLACCKSRMCKKQGGSIANVVVAGIDMYEQMEKDTDLDKERKILAFKKNWKKQQL